MGNSVDESTRIEQIDIQIFPAVVSDHTAASSSQGRKPTQGTRIARMSGGRRIARVYAEGDPDTGDTVSIMSWSGSKPGWEHALL
jgi:hypothetical protein